MASEEPKNRVADAVLTDSDTKSPYSTTKVRNVSSSPERACTQTEQPTDRSESPVDKCAICLCTPENRSYTDSCYHEFCFVCLAEWSKVKAECPLCKSKFKNIIHNIRSMSDYDELEVKEPQRQAFGGREIERVGRGNVSVDVSSPLFGLDESGRRFRYNSTMTAERIELISHIRALQSRLRELQQTQQNQLVRQQSERLQRLAHMFYRSSNRPETLRASLEFRRMIYERGLFVTPVQLNEQNLAEDTEGIGINATESVNVETYRDTSPQFYRDNPAQLHRLLRWLHRELNVFFQNRPNQVNFICNHICALIGRFDLRSEELRRRLRIILRQFVDHFLHEFYHFARSPMEMDQYDRVARYERRPGQTDNDLRSINLPNPPISLMDNAINEEWEEPELLSVSSSPSPIVEEHSISTPSSPSTLEPSTSRVEVNDNLAQLRSHLNNARDRLTCLQDAASSSSSAGITVQDERIDAQRTETDAISLSSSSSPDFSYRRSFDVSPSLSSTSHRSHHSEVIFSEPETLIGSQSPQARASVVNRPTSRMFSSSDADDTTWRPAVLTSNFRQSRDDEENIVVDEDEDSDDVEIVAEMLPKHLRTPEILEVDSSLSSNDSDIDVAGETPPQRNEDHPCCSKSLKEEDTAAIDRKSKLTLRSVVLPTAGFLRTRDSPIIANSTKEEENSERHKRKKLKDRHRSRDKDDNIQHHLKKRNKRSRSREKQDSDGYNRKKNKKYSKRYSNSD